MTLQRTFLLSLLSASAFMIAACAEIKETKYPTLLKAQEQGAVRSGWVPDWLPSGASDIQEAHDLEAKESMLRFKVPVGTEVSVPEACKPVKPRSPPGPPFSRDWWPGDVPASVFATHRHAFFGCNGFFVAYSSSDGEGFVWRRR